MSIKIAVILKNNLKCWKPGLSHFKYLDMVVKKTSSSHYQVWPNYNARALAISLNSISIILRKIKLNNCDISGSWDFKKIIFSKNKKKYVRDTQSGLKLRRIIG